METMSASNKRLMMARKSRITKQIHSEPPNTMQKITKKAFIKKSPLIMLKRKTNKASRLIT